MMDPTECLLNCFAKLWIIALTLADVISDFLYFEELYSKDQVPDGVAFAVLVFGLVGLVSFLIGLQSAYASCGTAVSIVFEDVAVIIVTTAVQAYVAGYDVRQWESVAIVSYVFSLFAMQQKAMKLGLVEDVGDVLHNRGADREEEIGPCFWWVVILRSLGAVGLALVVAWSISMFIIFFAPDPPDARQA